MHLKHIGPLGLIFLKIMFKTALKNSIIPHIWKLAMMVPIPKPNKDIYNGTSYSPISIITVALYNEQSFRHKLVQNNILGTIKKIIANYIKGRKTYTTYRNHTYIQRQFKTGVPQGGVQSPTLFNMHTAFTLTTTQSTGAGHVLRI